MIFLFNNIITFPQENNASAVLYERTYHNTVFPGYLEQFLRGNPTSCHNRSPGHKPIFHSLIQFILRRLNFNAGPHIFLHIPFLLSNSVAARVATQHLPFRRKAFQKCCAFAFLLPHAVTSDTVSRAMASSSLVGRQMTVTLESGVEIIVSSPCTSFALSSSFTPR